MKLFGRFHTRVGSRANRASSTPDQRREVHGGAEEEEFSYQSTRSISSYYSIFVARLAIMVMLAILIGMLTILTWHFTRIYTTNSINSLAYDLRYELLQRPILRMWNILNSTMEITVAQVKLSEYVIGRYENPVAEAHRVELHQAMRDITWALFASRKALNAMTISYRNGLVQAFHRDRRSNNTFYIYSDVVGSSSNQGKSQNIQAPISKDDNVSTIWYREPLDPITGEKKGDRRQIPPDDLMNIVGLPEVRDGAASWRVAVGRSTESPLLLAALPVRHPSGGSIIAAVGVTTALKSVGQLMKELVGIHSGYMYLTSREGYVLATSTDAPLLRNTTSGLKLTMANDSQDHMIRSGAEWLQRAHGNQFPISHEVHAENVVLGSQRYYIDSFFLDLKRLPLVGVIIIPRKYIMGNVDHIGFTTLIISISASLCILIIGCVCILILTSGVSKAMKLKAELISHLDARRRAEASSNYKSQFLANMSHELRTPMAAVIGLLDILIYDNCLTNEQVATVTQIRRCSTALLRLLNNILDLSKVESGKLVLEEAEFDLGRELEGLVDMFSVQCINHNVEIILDLSDDMPKVVRGDSARVVQIFTNLISNSIKFTLEGHIILRGWCESSIRSSKSDWSNDQKESQCALQTKLKQHESLVRKDCTGNARIILRFEVEDTGCGIEPRKWESVFESFEQADPSTTRTHGGTGLGLCIVRNFVNKMGGEIKVAKKDGPGTLMQLYLVLGLPEGSTGKHFQVEFDKHSLMCGRVLNPHPVPSLNIKKVLLALLGSKGRFIMSQWLRENGICTWEASEWNELTQILQKKIQGNVESPTSDPVRSSKSNVVIVVDTGLLDQNSNIWKEQLIFLDKYSVKANVTWVLSPNTSNAIKEVLRKNRHSLMVNKPLYKTKMVQILQSIIQEGYFRNQRQGTSENSNMLENLHEFHDIDPISFDTVSSDGSDMPDIETMDSRINAFSNGEKRREIMSAYHHSHYQTSNSREESAQTVSFDGILRNPNMFLTREKLPDISKEFIKSNNYGDKSIDCSRRHEQNTMNLLTEKLKNPESHLAIRSLEKCSNVFIEMNRLHIRDESMIQQEYQCPTKSTSNDVEDTKQKSTEYRNASTSNVLQAEQSKEQLGSQSLQEFASRYLKPTKNQDVDYSYEKEECLDSSKMVSHQYPLGGLNILLAEDNPILQHVATAMLEKVGARVVAVGDGMQAVDAMRHMLYAAESRRKTSTQQDGETKALKQLQESPTFDLVLMDCQMPKLDGYEATKAIRKLQAGTGSHIPIVAVTAHAMSSDETKCLEVGMDAYLTKPIDCNLMVSTILSLTKRRYL